MTKRIPCNWKRIDHSRRSPSLCLLTPFLFRITDDALMSVVCKFMNLLHAVRFCRFGSPISEAIGPDCSTCSLTILPLFFSRTNCLSTTTTSPSQRSFKLLSYHSLTQTSQRSNPTCSWPTSPRSSRPSKSTRTRRSRGAFLELLPSLSRGLTSQKTKSICSLVQTDSR